MSRTNPPSISLVQPRISQKWLEIIDLLSSASLVAPPGDDAASFYEALKNGDLDTFSSNGMFPLSDGSLRFDYRYRRGDVAHLKLKGFFQSNQAGVTRISRIDTKIADPDFIFPLYRAQRQARCERKACQLCGEPLTKKDLKKRLWRHDFCSTYIPYTADEENQVRRTGSFSRGTPQIGSNAPASNNVSNVVNQNSSESFLSRISRKFLSRR